MTQRHPPGQTAGVRLDLGAAFQRFFTENLVAVLAGEGEQVVLANDAFLELVGYSRAELEAGGIDWVALTPPEWLERDAVDPEELRRSGRVGPFFKEYRHRDGHRVPVHISAVLIGEEPFQWCSVVVDLSAQRAAERTSERTAAMLSAVVREAPIGIAFLDPELRFVHVNEALAQMNGVSREDHVGRTVAELVPDVAEQAVPLLQHVLETGEPLVDIEVAGETAAQPGVRRDWLETFYRVDVADEPVGVGVVADRGHRSSARRASTAQAHRRAVHLRRAVLARRDAHRGEPDRARRGGAARRRRAGRAVLGDVLVEPRSDLADSGCARRSSAARPVRRRATTPRSGCQGDRRITIDFQLVPLIEQGDVTALIPSGVDITDRMTGVRQLEHTAALARRLSAVGLVARGDRRRARVGPGGARR